MIIDKKNSFFNLRNSYYYILITLGISMLIFYLSIIYEYEIYMVFHTVSFLTWHTILEFTSIIIAFIIFVSCFHSYIHIRRIRLLILSIAFLIVGVIDFLHVISYDGMPYTFVESSAAMATTYWIIGRLCMSLGFLIASIIPFEKKVRINQNNVLIGAIFTCLFLFYLVTYRIDLLPPMYIEGVGLTKIKIILEYMIMMFQCITILFILRTYSKIKENYLIGLCCGLILSIFSEALFTLYKSVFDTYNLLGHIYKIIAYYLFAYGLFKYNIDTPYIELKKAENRIKLYANNLEKIVDKRTLELKEANSKLTSELDYARYVQQSILPKNRLDFEGISFVSRYLPCERLSGDFYGFYEIDRSNIGMYILDVSGHGVPAALLTVLGNNYLRSFNQTANFLIEPHKVLQSFFTEFNKMNFPDEMYIVTMFAVYNKESKILSYSSGGINCFPILVRLDGTYEILDKSYGFPICKFIESYEPEYVSVNIQLDKGDKIIFYTDGLVEKRKNEVIDENELINILINNCSSNNNVIDSKIYSRINISDGLNNDDISYFIMEVL